jgi:hypothetical protein
VFAGRKYTQPIKDDIGDKSVFEFYKLSPQEQEQKLQEVAVQQLARRREDGGAGAAEEGQRQA